MCAYCSRQNCCGKELHASRHKIGSARIGVGAFSNRELLLCFVSFCDVQLHLVHLEGTDILSIMDDHYRISLVDLLGLYEMEASEVMAPEVMALEVTAPEPTVMHCGRVLTTAMEDDESDNEGLPVTPGRDLVLSSSSSTTMADREGGGLQQPAERPTAGWDSATEGEEEEQEFEVHADEEEVREILDAEEQKRIKKRLKNQKRKRNVRQKRREDRRRVEEGSATKEQIKEEKKERKKTNAKQVQRGKLKKQLKAELLKKEAREDTKQEAKERAKKGEVKGRR